MDLKEFQKRVCYQIYPASFKDSNNDGRGDLNGIISKLDYLHNLGIGMIWLSPIYSSPMDDMGYDISDYKAINPLFGTMEDFECLIKEAKKRDILIVMDLVINHTSTEHEWFKKALSGQENNKYRDYYFIKRGKKAHKKPNNWQATFTGSAWIEAKGLPGYYYMHLFCDTQADLNYKNENVIKEIEDVIRFWLDKGVYGFRCDVINHIYKTSLKDDHSHFLINKGSKYYLNQEGMYTVLTRIRTEVLDNYDTFLVGETGNITPKIGQRLIKERCLDTFFEFEHPNAYRGILPIFKKKFNPKQFMNLIMKWQHSLPWMANYLENHDQLRSINMYGNEDKYYLESGKLLATLLLTLKGTPFIYQGEEIGMLNNDNLRLSETNDICAHMVFKTAKRILKFYSDEKLDELIANSINRDQARSPFQWSDDVNAGFNEGAKTWIPIHNDYEKINANCSVFDSNSIFNYYKKLIEIRKNNLALLLGEIKEEVISKSLIVYSRYQENEKFLIVLNFSDKTIKYKKKNNLQLVISNYSNEISFDNLPPYFAGIYKVNK